ncbi:MAG TPA: SUMF1/EgtB/PvdO family nonheme iron enzyme [Planctomycetota bacterium]|nr:SUMF1/EgtB/PvdO family nonheme iron enzyme [Planctomycetota bacterium]
MSARTPGAVSWPASCVREHQVASTHARSYPPADGGGRSRRVSAGFVVGLLLLTACSPSPTEGSPRPEVEQFAFVPKGWAAPFVGMRCEVQEDLLVDRFEVTRGRWEYWRARSETELADLEDWAPLGAGEYLPAVGMTHGEAEALAAARGMRLPTAAEWMFIAGGSRAQSWPHGNTRRVSVANTVEMGLRHSASVGTFPGGASTGTGVEDLVGNVWEWVAPPLPDQIEPMAWRLQGPSPYPLWAMGGSYQVRAQELFSFDGVRRFNATGLEAGHRADDLGLRCVVGAREYLLKHASSWSRPAWRERMLAVGRSWGRRAVPLLARMVEEGDGPSALAWLLEGARG